MPLEILAEEDEARLISLGIMSGLRFHLPLGLFLDIGGGSVEIDGCQCRQYFLPVQFASGPVASPKNFCPRTRLVTKEIK